MFLEWRLHLKMVARGAFRISDFGFLSDFGFWISDFRLFAYRGNNHSGLPPMKRFVFTLEAVRTVRQQAEQRASLHYARTQRRHQEELDRLQRAEAEARAAWQEARSRLENPIAALDLERLSRYARLVEQRRKACAEAVATSQRTLDEAAQKWLEARRQCELVETYYRKQRADYDRALLVEEQKLLDEVASRSGSLLGNLSFEAGRER